MGTDTLFEIHTIKEIQEIEKKLRNDIEQKKEELRQMVGERYRDLMEAADTITEMKDIAKSVTQRIKAIEENSSNLQKENLQSGILPALQQKVLDRRKNHEFLYSVASQLKILMDAPTKIWSSIESKDYTSAASLYLLARHTHSNLLLDPIYTDENIFQHFPIIKRQMTSVNHLRFVLTDNCNNLLRVQKIEAESVVGPLCCSCLLEDASPEKMFNTVLDARKEAIKDLFRPEKSAKSQICELATVIHTTLQIIYFVFYPESSDFETNLLVNALNMVTSKEHDGPVSLLDLKSSEILKFLPETIKDFRPSLKSLVEPCRKEILQEKMKEWLNNINKEFKPSITEILNYVNSIKSLSQIRKALFEQLLEIKRWNEICKESLNMSLSVWDYFLKECFIQRVKDIIDEKIKSTSALCQKDIEFSLHNICNEKEKSTLEFDRNISMYVWMESQEDILENVAWTPHHQINLWENGNLSMKALAFTPKIQSICRDLNSKLKEALEDIYSFSCDNPDEDVLEARPNSTVISFHKMSEETSVVYSYLSDVTKKYFFDLASYFETLLLYLGEESDSYENSCRIVFLGNLCHALTKLCPHINTCLSFSKLLDDKKVEKSSSPFCIQSLSKENPMWKELKKRFMESSDLAFGSWSNHRINNLLKQLDSELNICSVNGLLKALLKWDKVEIQEESEQGNAVKSVLRIPQHVSAPLSNALFTFCCQINAIGGHTISSQVRSHIRKQLLAGLLEIYGKKVEDKWSGEEYNPRIVQVQSLQILFDIQFLMSLMVHKDSSSDVLNNVSQEIIAKLITRIDPFDMDVFSVPLQQNLKRALQKSLSLFGLLISPEQVSYLNSMKQQTIGSQGEPNIMLSSTTISRFPLLPLSSRPNTSSAYEVSQLFEPESRESEVKPLQSHSSSPNLTASDIPTNPMKSTSFYDRVTAMSSSWFGN